MRDLDFGNVEIRLAQIMKEQNVSINKLAQRAEMQRTQLKAYIHGDVQRVDLAILARLCFVLECELSDLLVYHEPGEGKCG